jgi:hypothetical protein
MKNRCRLDITGSGFYWHLQSRIKRLAPASQKVA